MASSTIYSVFQPRTNSWLPIPTRSIRSSSIVMLPSYSRLASVTVALWSFDLKNRLSNAFSSLPFENGNSNLLSKKSLLLKGLATGSISGVTLWSILQVFTPLSNSCISIGHIISIWRYKWKCQEVFTYNFTSRYVIIVSREFYTFKTPQLSLSAP